MIEITRTPEHRFKDIKDYPFEPNYCDIGGLNMHYVDEGPKDGEIVLLLHGEPSWSYLYRKMIPIIAGAGYRVIAPDLIGFGKSDKVVEIEDYTYKRHLYWTIAFIDVMQFRNITMFCQDWGGLIGLRIAAEHNQWFSRIIAANTILPTGDVPANKAFMDWREFSKTVKKFDIARVIQKGTVTELDKETLKAYNAPFPNETYKGGARAFPSLVPITPDDPQSAGNRRAWGHLMNWEKPFLTAFSDSDPIMKGLEKIFQSSIPGAKGQDHVIIEGAGHFLQEDKGEELAEITIKFIRDNPLSDSV